MNNVTRFIWGRDVRFKKRHYDPWEYRWPSWSEFYGEFKNHWKWPQGHGLYLLCPFWLRRNFRKCLEDYQKPKENKKSPKGTANYENGRWEFKQK